MGIPAIAYSQSLSRYPYHLKFTGIGDFFIASFPGSNTHANVMVWLDTHSLASLTVEEAVQKVYELIRRLGGTIIAVHLSRVDLYADFRIPGG